MGVLQRLIRARIGESCGAFLAAILLLPVLAFGDEAPTPASKLSNEQIQAELERLSKDERALRESADYERYMAGSARTKVIAVDGIEPNEDSIRTRKYPFVAEVLIVTRKDLDRNAPAARLRDWLLSPEGQAVVYESGYVSLPVTASK